MALLHIPGIRPSGPSSSNSLSTANLLPNSMSSTLYTAVPACCISWIADNDSSYLRVIFPERTENMRICLSGSEKVTKELLSGDKVMHVGIDFDFECVQVRSKWNQPNVQSELTFLNSYRSVWLLNDHNPETFLGSSNGSVGCQYSMKPASSAEMTVSNLSLYWNQVG